jgi:hypothetical protein
LARQLAESIAKGIEQKDVTVTVKLYNIARSDINDVVPKYSKSKRAHKRGIKTKGYCVKE